MLCFVTGSGENIGELYKIFKQKTDNYYTGISGVSGEW